MKIPRVQRPNKEGTNPGFKHEHQSILDKDDVLPKAAIISINSNSEEQEQQPLCAECGSKLFFLANRPKYMCIYSRCGRVIDAISNTPRTKTLIKTMK